MEMEHINDNTIRVVIQNEDLVARGITFLDLLGNHREIENFFYSILEEVDIEEEFQGSEAITFQVLPKGDGLELFISKNLTLEDMDAIGSNDQYRDEITNYLRNEMELDELQDDLASPDMMNNVVFDLAGFEDMVQLANEVFLDAAWTNLYHFNDHYYLQIGFSPDDFSKADVEDAVAQLLEFAKLTTVTSEMLAEHGRLLMERNAMELTRYYFR